MALPKVVRPELVEAALRAINRSLGSSGLPPDQLPTFRGQSYCPELRAAPPITALLHKSPLWDLAESAIGPGRLRPVTEGQIALRFPDAGPPSAPAPHLDGLPAPGNGIPPDTLRTFTALVGVFLSDLPRPSAGNFTVWPGSHRLYERHFREHGPQSLLAGLPPVALPAPVQLTPRAGDAVLCHYQLAHGVAGNAAPHIRYAVFFRLSHVAHDAPCWDCLTDHWREWEGLTSEPQAGRGPLWARWHRRSSR